MIDCAAVVVGLNWLIMKLKLRGCNTRMDEAEVVGCKIQWVEVLLFGVAVHGPGRGAATCLEAAVILDYIRRCPAL